MNKAMISAEPGREDILEKYQILVENLPVGVYRNTLGPDGHFLEANPAIVAMFEADSKEEFMKHQVSDFYQDREKRAEFVAKISQEGFVKNEELNLVTLKGKKIIASVSAVLNKDKQGTEYLDGFIEDITIRRQAEEALKKSHAELEMEVKKRTAELTLQTAALQAAANGVVITDLQGIIQWVNPAFTTLTGYTDTEIIGQSTRLLNSGKQDKLFYKNLWDTISSGKVWHGEMINKRKDGSFYTEEQIITPVKNDQGEIYNFIAIKQDISARKQAEIQLENSAKAMANVLEDLSLEKAKDEAILQSIGDGLIVTDEKGMINQVNETFEKLLGWKAQEVIGRQMLEVVEKVDENGEIIPPHKRSLFKVLTEGLSIGRVSTVSKTHAYICKDKSRLPIVGVVTPIIINKKIIGAVQVFRDASLEKQIDKAKSEFVTLASHELRTPLTAIDGLTAMILDGEYGEINSDLKQPLEDISISSERLIHLVNDMLDLSRMQTGKLKFTLTDFSIGKTVSEIVEFLQPVANQKGIKLTCTDMEEIRVTADADKVKQIMTNLIGNSIKFTNKGMITVSVKTGDDKAEVRITDTGIGIDKADQVKLFGKFEQLGKSLERPTGTGLGLYISKEMAGRMGGDIRLEKSEPGVGSTFVFSIPKFITPIV